MIKKHWPSTDNYGDFSLGEIEYSGKQNTRTNHKIAS